MDFSMDLKTRMPSADHPMLVGSPGHKIMAFFCPD